MKKIVKGIAYTTLGVALIAMMGCGSRPKAQNREFFTSGSREADQRATQRMAKQEQLTGSTGAGEKKAKKASPGVGGETGGTNKAAQALFDRLGGEAGISNVVADFVPRAIQDPRVNWERKGVTTGRSLFRHGKSAPWHATPADVAQLEKHLLQFFALATGGPAHYEGKEI